MAAPKKTKPCALPLTKDRYDEPDHDGPRCLYLRSAGSVKCQYHYLLRQPIEVQVTAAKQRKKNSEGMPHRARVRPDECPEGERFCAGCQSFVPLFYAMGSRCRACASHATHGSHVERTYQLPREEYEALLAWQNGRCYICQQVPRVRRLAVDHNHETGEVRGLLCANDEWGCNRVLARLLNDVEMARRALAYVENHPLAQLRAGVPGVRPVERLDWWVHPEADTSPPLSLEEWDPWNDGAPQPKAEGQVA